MAIKREPNSERVWLYVSRNTKRKLKILAAYNGTTVADLLTEAATKMIMEQEARTESLPNPQA